VNSLEPGQLKLMRVHSAATALVLLVAVSLADYLLHREAGLPRFILLAAALLPLLYLAFVSPVRRYRAWGYEMDADELQLRHGVWTQVHTIVPLERVQHIDISQGPLERGFAVCRLLVHTAGTMHSRVVLPGLARSTAEAMRDEIRARIRQAAAG
jgi:membrane protein YdbS with pleckstrin-like domain